VPERLARDLVLAVLRGTPAAHSGPDSYPQEDCFMTDRPFLPEESPSLIGEDNRGAAVRRLREAYAEELVSRTGPDVACHVPGLTRRYA
jgi:hypothetical protein